MANKSLSSINFKLRADIKQFSTGLQNAERKMKKFAKKMDRMGRNMSRNFTMPLLGAGLAAVKLGTDFEKSFAKIENLVGITGSELDNFKESVKKLSGETAKSPQELAEALFFVTSAGLRGKDALEALEASAKASAIGMGETAVVADAVTSVMNSYGSEIMSAGKATDILTALVRAGKVEAEEIAPVIGKVVGIASQMGIGFEEVAASMATFTRLGMPAAETATGLRSLLNGMISPTQQSKEALHSIGLTFDQLRHIIKEKGLADTLIFLMDAFKGNKEGLSKLIPNVRAFTTILSTAGAQGETYRQILDDITNSTGLVDKGFENVTKTTAHKFQQALSNLKKSAIEFGAILLPVVSKILDRINDLTGWMSRLSERTKKNIITFAALTAAIGPALIIVSKLTLAYITLRKTLFKTGAAMALFGTKLLRLSAAGLKANGIIGATTGVLRVLKTVVIANPIGALVVGLTTVIGLFKKFSKTVKGSTSDLESFDAASLTAAQRLAEINKELDNSGKTSLELKKEELNLTKDLIAENLKAAKIKLSGGVDEFGDDLSNMDVAYLRTQISNLEGDLTDYENTITRLTKKIEELKDPQGLSKFQPLKPSYAEDWGVDFNDVDWDKINAKQNEFAPLKPSYADQWGIDFNNVDFKTPLDGLTAKLEGITSKITGFAKKWGDHFGAAFSVIGHSLENQRIALDNFYAKESESIANSNMNAEEKAEAQLELDEKVAEKRKSILRKQAIAEKAAAIISAVINGAQAITKVSAQTGIAAVFAAPLMSALIGAQIALIAAQPIPQFAAGGIVSGPTLGIMGEYAGAKSNPEVIAPLNKLKSMLPGSGTETVIPDVRITGEDLLIVFERATRRKARR